MDYKKYRILYSPRVIDSLDKIYQYIAEEIGSVEAARRKVASIRKDIKCEWRRLLCSSTKINKCKNI